MRKRLLVCLTAVLCTLGLSGCIFGDVDEMYALPKSSEAYVNLQARINQEKGNAESIAPLSGENRQAIQLVDVDRELPMIRRYSDFDGGIQCRTGG